MRLLNVFLGSTIPVIIFLIALKLYTQKVALLASFISVISPNLIYISQFLRVYSMAIFFTLCAILFFTIYLEKRSSLCYYALSALCSIYASYFSILALIPIGVFFLLQWKSFTKKETIAFIGANVFVVLLYLPWIPFMLSQISNIILNDVGSHGKLMLANKFGTYIGNVHVGALIRGLSGIFQMDHTFLINFRLHTKLNPAITIIIVCAASIAVLQVILKSYKYLRKIEKVPQATLFIFLLVFLTFALAAISNILKGFPITPRYMGSCAAVFSIIMASFILSIDKKFLRYLVFLMLVVLFVFRIVDVWGFSDKEHRALDRHILKDGKVQALASFEINSFLSNEKYKDMNLIELKVGEENLAKTKLDAYDYFYIVEFKRPAMLMDKRYEATQKKLLSDFKLIECKKLSGDVISISLYGKKDAE